MNINEKKEQIDFSTKWKWLTAMSILDYGCKTLYILKDNYLAVSVLEYNVIFHLFYWLLVGFAQNSLDICQ